MGFCYVCAPGGWGQGWGRALDVVGVRLEVVAACGSPGVGVDGIPAGRVGQRTGWVGSLMPVPVPALPP